MTRSPAEPATDRSALAPALPQQDWNAEAYARHAAYVPAFGEALVALLAPQPGERVLDVGCGNGTLTRIIAEAGADVVGVDSSRDQVAAATALGLDARLLDAANLDFDGVFDAVFSNAALHWMADIDAVLAGIQRALKPGGRFVGELGGHGNIAAIRVALAAVLPAFGASMDPLPWYFPTASAYATRLRRHRFIIDEITLFARPTPLATGIEGWLETFAASLLARVPASDRAAATRAVVDLLRPVLCDTAGEWTADYVRLRFAARRPADAPAERAPG
jgi:SAM-dependent methyltransferase